MRFQFIHENRSSFPVKKMCLSLHVSQSGYYRWINAPISKRKIENLQLRARIKELFHAHNGMAGSPMITADLHDDPAFSTVSRPRVARMMKEMGLKCKTVRKFVVTTDSKHDEPIAPNLLNRQFTVPAPDIAWVGDITYVKVATFVNIVVVFPIPHFYNSIECFGTWK